MAAWLNSTRQLRLASTKTIERRVTSFRAWGKYVGQPFLAEYKPPTPVRGTPHPLPGGIADVRRMVALSRDPEERYLTVLCGLVGLRVSEARAVASRHVDTQTWELLVLGKGEKDRSVPLSDEALEHLLYPIVTNDPGSHFVSLSDRHARRRLTLLGARAGISRRVASHDLRATFATEAYNRTLDIRVVQMLLGHASVETTQIYTGIAQAQMRKAVDFSG